MSSEQAWDFTKLGQTKSDIDQAGGQIGNALDDGRDTLGRLATVWGGSGSEAFQGVQTRWNETSDEVKNSLLALSNAIGEATQAMAQAESANMNRFG